LFNSTRGFYNKRSFEKFEQYRYFSLQKDLRLRAYTDKNEPIDLTAGAEDLKIVDLAPFITDFQDTAAFIEGLDLVITVDTAVLHLAGAIGKPTYAMIPFNPDWRWGIDGNKTIWYPSVTMFRQEEVGNWDTVIQNIAEAL
jgi:ADP-heptose:LPS heptosyltransferase